MQLVKIKSTAGIPLGTFLVHYIHQQQSHEPNSKNQKLPNSHRTPIKTCKIDVYDGNLLFVFEKEGLYFLAIFYFIKMTRQLVIDGYFTVGETSGGSRQNINFQLSATPKLLYGHLGNLCSLQVTI